MKVARATRHIALSGVCVALLAGVAACGGGSSTDRTALEAQLTKGPFTGYEKFFSDHDGNPLSAGDAKKRLDCYADVLLKYGDKKDLATYMKTGEGYVKIGLSEPKKFRVEADACLADAARLLEFSAPYPAAGFV